MLPSGGWSHLMVGDPDRGFGKRQPGSWDYSILPFIEQTALHDLGRGLTGAAKSAINVQRITTPLTAYNCPTRRRPVLYTVGPS